MRVVGWLFCVMVGWWGVNDALAGTLYRCESPDGSRSYSSKRVPGASCSAVASYTKQPASKWQPVASASAATITPVTPANAQAAVSASPVVSAPMSTSSSSSRRVSGRVYTYKRNGITYASTTPPRGVAASSLKSIPFSYMEACFACGAKPGVNFGTLRLNTSAYQAEIDEAARLHGVDPAIVRAIIHAESAYNPKALSRVGAQGLMQLMPATARRFGVTNAFDARQNIHGGVQYLAWLLKRFKGDLTLASAGYNAGEGAVDKYKGVPPYSETRRYVERVRVLADRYRGQLASR
ncbi:lytic transglycosylase domain-containing protein [Solilutibacter tolerans]|uniref:Soluble lytic murein transglycosylase n=1 Tax=Solilutibacter tolerans TaxID=1604334 RepID=A0A1N6NQ32_9GAMM|nr:Soluble lytic murein transglycosylase [Lysobacter tolerans]